MHLSHPVAGRHSQIENEFDCGLFYRALLQKRPMILRSLLTEGYLLQRGCSSLLCSMLRCVLQRVLQCVLRTRYICSDVTWSSSLLLTMSITTNVTCAQHALQHSLQHTPQHILQHTLATIDYVISLQSWGKKKVTYKAQALAFRIKKSSKCIRNGIFVPPFAKRHNGKKTESPIKHRHFY